MTDSRVIFITGAAQGIGREITRYFLARGNRVVMADADVRALKAAAAQERRSDLNRTHDEVLSISLNVAKEPQVRRAILQTTRHFGRLDVLVNNAGLVIEPTPGFRVDLWNKIIETNLTGSFLCAKYAIPHLKKMRGSIINIASTRALMSEPHTEGYSASKGGLVALTHSLAISLGPDIRVNCISPGWINSHHESLRPKDHQQHPAGRVGEPQDIAAMTHFLASTEASFITGQNFVVDGGMTRRMIYS
jgi:NAD(P)-dependent dehydrogenase (short-subunit alcohol dehydrogenase family)